MTWFIFAITSTVLLGAQVITSKRVLLFESGLKFLTVLASAQFLVLLPLIPFVSIPSSEAFILLAVQSLILTVGLMLQFEVLRKLPISTVAPLNNLMPLFLYSYAFFILEEKLTGNQLNGFLVLLLGAYLVNYSPKDIFEPVKKIFKSRETQWLLLSLMILAAVAMMDKLIFSYGVDVISLLFFSQLLLAINTLGALFLAEGKENVIKAYKTKGGWVLVTAVIKNLGNLAYLKAVSIAPVSLVIPFRQLASVVAAIVGGTIFKEKHLVRKGIASIIMVLGVLLIIL